MRMYLFTIVVPAPRIIPKEVKLRSQTRARRSAASQAIVSAATSSRGSTAPPPSMAADEESDTEESESGEERGAEAGGGSRGAGSLPMDSQTQIVPLSGAGAPSEVPMRGVKRRAPLAPESEHPLSGDEPAFKKPRAPPMVMERGMINGGCWIMCGVMGEDT